MRRVAAWVTGVLGGFLVAAGIGVFILANRAPAADFGWFAYAPLQPEGAYDSRLQLSFDDRWTVLWTGGHLVGIGLLVLGLLTLVGLVGWLLGRRSGRRVSGR